MPSTGVTQPTIPASQSAGVPSANGGPVKAEHRAVIGVFDDIDAAHTAVERLVAAGSPVDRLSIIGKDLQSETRLNGFVTVGDIAGPAAATGAWLGGVFGLLAGTALLFVPGAGPLIVLGPLAGAALGAAEGAIIGGGVGALLGHFVADRHIPKYEELVRAGSYLVVVHGGEDEVTRAAQLLSAAGSTDVQRHDERCGGKVGLIAYVREGMRVVDADGKEVGKATFVKFGDPEAITAQGQDFEVKLPHELAERLLRIGFVKVDRKGIFTRDVYVAADQIANVEAGTVVLSVGENELLREV